MALDWTFAVLLVLASLGSALVGATALAFLPVRDRGTVRRAFDPEDLDRTGNAVFLFEDERLVDASDAGRALLRDAVDGVGPWAGLCTVLAPAFPDMQARVATLAQVGRITLTAANDPALQLQAEWRRGIARLTLTHNGTDDDCGAGPFDRLALRALEDEVALLRDIVQRAPTPVWCQRPDGGVTWANRAYLLHAVAHEGEVGALTWPLPRLFHGLEVGADGTAPGRPIPACLRGPDGGTQHFEVHAMPRATELVLTALPADAAAQARKALRDLTQTLTQTFAQLPTGLAVFDRDRRLQMFNPALADLTHLGPDTLAMRPSLEAFLDQMRSAKRIPEPRDYRTWRQGIVQIETAAASGTYVEVWPLPSGHTLRVTGRPHPDGAIAFLFEDISSEVLHSRRFRGEIETGRAVLDAIDEAIAVFSPDGTLILTNAAYNRLWDSDPARRPGEIGVQAALRNWLERAQPNPMWHRLRRYVTGAEVRVPLTTVVQMKDGRHLSCRLAPLAGGATLIGFCTPSGPMRASGPEGTTRTGMVTTMTAPEPQEQRLAQDTRDRADRDAANG